MHRERSEASTRCLRDTAALVGGWPMRRAGGNRSSKELLDAHMTGTRSRRVRARSDPVFREVIVGSFGTRSDACALGV